MFHPRPSAAARGSLVVAGALFTSGLTATGIAHGEQAAQAPIEEIVVTGSRIQRANVTATSPVTQLDAQDLQLTGITRVEDVLRFVSESFVDESQRGLGGCV